MKNLIEELRQAADAKPADCPELFEKAADAIESQAATIARYETTAENYELLQAKVDDQAREIERQSRLVDGATTVTAALMEELAALLAQQGKAARDESTLSLSEFGDAEKVRLSVFIENEDLGPMGATRIEHWRLSDNRIVRAEWSMGGASFFIESKAVGDE